MTLLEQDNTTAGPRRGQAYSLAATGMFALSLLGGTGTFQPAPRQVLAVHDSASTGNGGYPADDAAAPERHSTAEAVRSVGERSGLSWDQVGRLFGVSRRSVHKWLNGGAMTAHHADRLGELTRIVYSHTGSAAQVRAQLLAPDTEGRSAFDRLVVEARGGRERLPQLSGALRDGEVTLLGETAEVVEIDEE